MEQVAKLNKLWLQPLVFPGLNQKTLWFEGGSNLAEVSKPLHRSFQPEILASFLVSPEDMDPVFGAILESPYGLTWP